MVEWGLWVGGINSADAAVIMATGTMWMMVPESCLVTLKGRPKKGVTAKDIALKIQTIAPPDHLIYKAIEIGGDYAHEMSVASRLVIANMMCETGAKCGILPPDQVVADYLEEKLCSLASDPDAGYADRYEVDLDALEAGAGLSPRGSECEKLSPRWRVSKFSRPFWVPARMDELRTSCRPLRFSGDRKSTLMCG